MSSTVSLPHPGAVQQFGRFAWTTAPAHGMVRFQASSDQDPVRFLCHLRTCAWNMVPWGLVDRNPLASPRLRFVPMSSSQLQASRENVLQLAFLTLNVFRPIYGPWFACMIVFFDLSRPSKPGWRTCYARPVHNVLAFKHDHTLITVRPLRSSQPPEPKECVEHGGFALELGRG